MSCSEVMELMQRYLDHDLTEMEQQTMVSHFSHCPECAAMFERLQQLSEGLEALPDVRPPYSIVDSILPILDEPLPEKPVFTSVPGGRQTAARKDRRKLLPRVMYGGTAAAALILGVFLFQSYYSGMHSGAENTAIDAGAPSVGGQIGSGAPEAGDVNPQQPEKTMLADKMASPSPDEGSEAKSKLMTPNTADSHPAADSLRAQDQFGQAAFNGSDAKRSASTEQAAAPDRGLTSSIATAPEESSSTPDSGSGEHSITGLVPETKLPETPTSGTGAFVKPVEISKDDTLDAAKSGLSNYSSGVLLSSNVDLSRLASPNDKYLASVENQRVTIRDTSGTIVFGSPVQWEDGDTVQLTEWANNYQLLYVVKRSDGDLYEYMIDLALKKELKK
ncbi:zf-HC2 domain-containing protein [Gorillibacterium timonense]|uniref:zf-HC2 domain-containing protein n=1 Tax=Gorillibacterium timonense TaxID=1689269 RepID=UPI00071CEFF2|nr:zf-HC2 domain-containing protein [Gorillibacterium timonense]